MIRATRCVLCGRALFKPGARVAGGAIGPTCARKIGMSTRKARLRRAAIRSQAPEFDPRQVDWVMAADLTGLEHAYK